MTEEFKKQIETQARQAVTELLAEAKLKKGDVFVVGCSSSEIVGGHIGKDSSLEAAQAVYAGIAPVLAENGIWLAAQCCEHLNRAIIIEREAAEKYGWEEVCVVPRPHAGGSWATTCWKKFREPVAVEEIRAHAGIDIGGTLIGMHLKRVAVPVRLSLSKIGEANILCARTRPKLIGGEPAAVQLCAACKTRTAQTVAASAALPIDVFGENHVQELCANFDAGAYCGKPSHFIGHLQTNKIKKVLGRASLIQSVDSEHLLNAIEKEAAKAGIVQNVLLEVNIGGEESKTGVAPEALWPLLDAAAAQEHIRVKGLMAIPPVNDDDARNRRYLAEVYKLFVQAGERGYSNVSMETLSMGMSGDFENAIREGATLVRIGTAIYGERDYSKKV